LCNLPVFEGTPSPEIYLFLDINHGVIIHFHYCLVKPFRSMSNRNIG
jgi:hypothetical protein